MKYKVTYLDENSKRTIKYINSNKEDIIRDFNQGRKRLINIEAQNSSKDFSFTKEKKKIKLKELSVLLKQLSILLGSGLDFKLAISILSNQEKNRVLKTSLEQINKNLDDGFSISQAFDKTKTFPDLLIGVIEAGESSSRLEQSLSILADYYEDEEKTKQMLKNALYYPSILLLVTFIVTVIIVYIVLPRYVDLYTYYDGLELPALTQGLIKTSKFLLKKGWVFFLGIISLVLGIRKFSSEKLKIKRSKARLSFPFIGSYILAYEVERFSGIFSLLIDSGIETMDAINKAAKSVNNLYLRQELSNLNKEILEGHTLYETFSKIEILPPMFINLINVGEMSSNLATTMNMSFTYYKNIVKEKSKKLTALFEPLIIIIVSLIVGTVVVAIALPMFSLVDLVNF